MDVSFKTPDKIYTEDRVNLYIKKANKIINQIMQYTAKEKKHV